MSVSDLFTLPAQPASGSAKYGPMGGDGRTSPLCRYEVNVALAMDAGGGTFRVGIDLDPQFMNLVAMMQLNIDRDNAEPFRMDISLGDQANPVQFNADGVLKVNHNAGNASITWSPPPLIDPIRVDFRLANTDTFTGTCDLIVYCFRKGNQHITPIEKVFQVLTRAGSLI